MNRPRIFIFALVEKRRGEKIVDYIVILGKNNFPVNSSFKY